VGQEIQTCEGEHLKNDRVKKDLAVHTPWRCRVVELQVHALSTSALAMSGQLRVSATLRVG